MSSSMGGDTLTYNLIYYTIIYCDIIHYDIHDTI
jgi:hypothetical protein